MITEIFYSSLRLSKKKRKKIAKSVKVKKKNFSMHQEYLETQKAYIAFNKEFILIKPIIVLMLFTKIFFFYFFYRYLNVFFFFIGKEYINNLFKIITESLFIDITVLSVVMQIYNEFNDELKKQDVIQRRVDNQIILFRPKI
uniref:hypothetical protein n=1 Tax=Cephaleuros parasiticus TaxID=173370 RepID=UPI001EE0386E|nr:hypothetical protein MFQ79_pgp052 [Cephaleuros parasiticus]UIB39010.1 hypothetical protein [Cephaleuros parasiticus]